MNIYGYMMRKEAEQMLKRILTARAGERNAVGRHKVRRIDDVKVISETQGVKEWNRLP
jgi:hypothetical protein